MKPLTDIPPTISELEPEDWRCLDVNCGSEPGMPPDGAEPPPGWEADDYDRFLGWCPLHRDETEAETLAREMEERMDDYL
jgi:hypothetical protein